jgi:hypothetical protein
VTAALDLYACPECGQPTQPQRGHPSYCLADTLTDPHIKESSFAALRARVNESIAKTATKKWRVTS